MGVPTVVIATERFAALARQSGVDSGLDGARIAAVAHPVGGIAQDEVVARADAVCEDVLNRLLGR